jgi:hypothetical protein
LPLPDNDGEQRPALPPPTGQLIQKTSAFAVYRIDKFYGYDKRNYPLYQCDACNIQISDGFLGAVSRPFNWNSVSLFGRDGTLRFFQGTIEPIMLKINDAFAAIVMSTQAFLFHSEMGTIGACTNIACDLTVTQGFAYLLHKDHLYAALYDLSGHKILEQFSATDTVEIKDHVVAVSDGNHHLVVYDWQRGKVFESNTVDSFSVDADEVRVTETMKEQHEIIPTR